MGISTHAATFLAATALASLVTSCGYDRRSFTELSVDPVEKDQVVAAVRYLSACPTDFPTSIAQITPPEAQSVDPNDTIGPRIAIPTVAVAADAAVELIGIGLKRASERLNGTFLATGVHLGGEERAKDANGTSLSVDDGCVVVYQGVAGETVRDTAGDGLSKQVLSALKLSGQPAFYLELKSKTSTPQNRVLAVNHIQYAATSALRTGSGRKTVTVALGFGGTGKTANDPEEGKEIYLINLGQLEVGSTYGGTLGQTVAAPRKAGEYFNMVAKVTESEDPSVALVALTTAFDKNKDDLAAALAEALK